MVYLLTEIQKEAAAEGGLFCLRKQGASCERMSVGFQHILRSYSMSI